MRIICDFDGTITRRDTTDAVLEALAGPEWKSVEQMWIRGEISAADCMRRQVAMIGGDDAALDAALNTLELDDGFVAFVEWCEAEGLALTVVSDGVDYFIRRILERHGLGRIRVVANRLEGRSGERRLEQPWRREGCAAGSGVCKCEAARRQAAEASTPMVFVGDGRSDFCVSARAQVLFAKDQLAAYAASRGQPFHLFESFHDVTRVLSAMVAASAPRRAAGAATLPL